MPAINIQKVDPNLLARYNTCNYPCGEALDYEEELVKTSLHLYIDFLNALEPDNPWIEVSLSDRTTSILKKFNSSSWKTNRLSLPPDCSDDDFSELWSCAAELRETGLFDGSRWFFRFTRNSPKDGTPFYPVVSEQDVLEKISTSARASLALGHGNRTLYFKKYKDELNPDREMRIFVHNRNMTAISTYSTYNTDLALLPEEKLQELAAGIYSFWSCLPLPGLLPPSYTMDIYTSEDLSTFQIIEFNSFGYWMAAGSCMFDWLDDYKVLYGDGSTVVFRLART